METVKAFAEYGGFVAEQLSDRVKHFFTINEFRPFVDAGYRGTDAQIGGGKSVHLGAPRELQLPTAEFKQVRHHTVRAHGLAVRAIRACGAAGTKVGPAENIAAAVPVIDAAEHVKAAEIATRELNAAFLTVMLEGRYTDAYVAEAGADAPRFTDEDLKVISTPVDFVGINVYRPNVYVAPSDERPGYRTIPISASQTKMASAWHIVDPDPAPARDLRRRAGRRLLPVERSGQLRADLGLRRPLRDRLRRLRDPGTDPQAERPKVSRNSEPERCRVSAARNQSIRTAHAQCWCGLRRGSDLLR
jgi:hypothetical protein